MGTYKLLPTADEVNNAGTQADNVGKTQEPLFLILRCHEFSNTPSVRANGGSTIHKFILPFPESTPTGVSVRYNEELAKEQGIVAKLFTETGNLASNLLNLPGRIIKDQFQSLSGVDLGRRPMDVTELSFLKAEKRQYSFNWTFTSISIAQSSQMTRICNLLTAFSLPSTAGRDGAGGSTRMIMPPMWTMAVARTSGSEVVNSSFATNTFLQDAKTCFLTSVTVDRDSSALMALESGSASAGSFKFPISFSLGLNFTEIDPLFRDDKFNDDGELMKSGLKSRSEIRAMK